MISTIGRKNFKVRLLISGIYLLLILGSVTMVYPFMLMIAGSTKSSVDLNELRVVPGFLTQQDTLYRKYLEGLFNEKMDLFKLTYDVEDSSFETAKLPTQINDQLVDAWDDYLQQANLNTHTSMVGMMEMPVTKTVQPLMLRDLMSELAETYQGDIHAVNEALGTEYTGWSHFIIRPQPMIQRRQIPTQSPLDQRLAQFYQTAPDVYRFYPSVAGMYRSLFLKTQYTRDIAEYNKAHQTNYNNYQQVYLTREFPADGSELQKEDWKNFVRQTVNLLWLTADESARPIFTRFLKARYASLQKLNQTYAVDFKSFDQVPMGGMQFTTAQRLVDWQNMIEGWVDPANGERLIIPIDAIRIDCVDFRFADYLLERFGSVEKINDQLGTTYQSVADIQTPQKQWHYRLFLENTGKLKWEFAIRNYVTVFNYIVLHGRGVFNTVVYCLLAIISALIVNPMAAYAMSRYKMPSTYKVLLFLMLTMAFPPMVTQIPNFLMLRELGLLNTFAALILPTLANGYSIFLLKGFFDSLPKELYESAGLDGANEWVMFWQITMNLSKPILAVIALQAFNHAYANFMFALLTCQDDSMWTLMVWLYQLQTDSTQGVVFASLMIAAIPTFIVFVFAQNIIMRGIVVPVEK
tara:strand:+ start:13833 stop:15737 length:1905 start_codon:yes stop_codon:yes gene_type:complete